MASSRIHLALNASKKTLHSLKLYQWQHAFLGTRLVWQRLICQISNQFWAGMISNAYRELCCFCLIIVKLCTSSMSLNANGNVDLVGCCLLCGVPPHKLHAKLSKLNRSAFASGNPKIRGFRSYGSRLEVQYEHRLAAIWKCHMHSSSTDLMYERQFPLSILLQP